ncbi:MAG: non-lysosomal glucosylceramidase [candidate division KSB1 bacterium]|nr:non-lysosomal glucosylceramidase [candidate division KSB1 bacterium]
MLCAVAKCALLGFTGLLFLASATSAGSRWAVLRRYDEQHIARIALPVGGIGTGTISFGGRGELRDWEIVNRAAKDFHAGPGVHASLEHVLPFFAIWIRYPDGFTQTKALLGPLADHEYESMMGTAVPNHGLPRFRHATFEASYPFGRVNLWDENMPVRVSAEAFNPLIPGDPEASGLPVFVLTYEVRNETDSPLDVSICGNFENFIGMDGHELTRTWSNKFVVTGAKQNRNDFRKGKGFQGIYMWSAGVAKEAPQWGTIAFVTLAEEGVSYRTATPLRFWGGTLLDVWDDFAENGRFDQNYEPNSDTPLASLAVSFRIPPRATHLVRFLIAWHFPNRQDWSGKEIVGNYYARQFKDAWDVVEKVVPQLPMLEEKTIEFVNALVGSDLPLEVKEAALFNLSTLRSNTCFRIPSGHLLGWEGTFDDGGCCHGSCTHVWNYEQATAFLFGTLAQSMREVEFGYATHPDGLMNFRVALPLEKNRELRGFAAADGQMGTIMKMYRDWQLSGDDGFLRRLWPNVRRALEFCWIPGGWDADKDGVMEGIQHNTMDVEYFGPNPQMGIWYLGALRAAEEMARYLGEHDFAQTCRALFENGSRWIDENLFNGEYYEHKVLVPQVDPTVLPMFRGSAGAKDLEHPDYQLANGCLVDQLVGQYMAHICGLGYLVEREHVRAALTSILRYNRRESLFDHFNNMRTYAAGDEAALLMAAYPKGRPKFPFSYFNEVMTGFEYTAAVGMLYEGMVEEGLRVIRDVRARYDGRRRNPFDEAECGHHYARAMASWAAVLAITGFHYSGVEKTLVFRAPESPVTWFWSNGYAWGTVSLEPAASEVRVVLEVKHGSLSVATLVLRDYGKIALRPPLRLTAPATAKVIVPRGTGDP